MNLRKDWQKWAAELAKSHASPDAVALGGGLGTLIAIFPTPGFNIVLGLLILAAFPKINKVALLGALAFWNPVVCTPLYALALHVGDWLFGGATVTKYQLVILNQVYNFTRRFLVGIAVIDLICALVVYAALWSIVTWRRHREE